MMTTHESASLVLCHLRQQALSDPERAPAELFERALALAQAGAEAAAVARALLARVGLPEELAVAAEGALAELCDEALELSGVQLVFCRRCGRITAGVYAHRHEGGFVGEECWQQPPERRSSVNYS
jgi:hypothetical protein